MTHHDEVVATDRLRQALLAFETARDLHLGAHRRLKALPPAEVEAFWDGPGRRARETMQAAATEVVTAFETLPGAGLMVNAGDRRLVSQAQRHLAGVMV
jgi:hypothetical protein